VENNHRNQQQPLPESLVDCLFPQQANKWPKRDWPACLVNLRWTACLCLPNWWFKWIKQSVFSCLSGMIDLKIQSFRFNQYLVLALTYPASFDRMKKRKETLHITKPKLKLATF